MLIIARHGAYDNSTIHLNSAAQLQIQTLADRLLPQVSGKRVLILSSVAPRAVKSADIVAKALGTTFEQHDVLWSENKHRENLPATLQLVKSKAEKLDLLILITHQEYGEQLPPLLRKRDSGNLSTPNVRR